MYKKTILPVCFLLCFSLLYQQILYAETKKKLFVNNIQAKEGIAKETAQKARDQITLSIFENFGKYYQIITDDDIQIMYKQAELMMASGSDSESAVVQVANAINADEIIYGNLTKDGGEFRLTVQNLERNSSDNSVSKKSFVNMAFFESKMEWHCREIAKKLIKPDYTIDTSKAKAKIIAKFEVEDIKFQDFKGVNIRKIKFEAQDEISTRIVNDLMVVVEKGDKYFEDNNFRNALREYRKTITTIGTKLRKETQKKIEPFTESVLERIAAVHTRDTQKNIEKVDAWLKSQNPITIEALKKGKENYEKIAKALLSVPSHEKIKMEPVLASLEDRLTSINLSWTSIYEEKADFLYGDYQFKNALAHYKAIMQFLNGCGVRNEKIDSAKQRVESKGNIARETGASWLENKVLSYCNAAEYLNMKNNRRKAETYLSQARALIEANKEFANERMVNAYKETARIIKR